MTEQVSLMVTVTGATAGGWSGNCIWAQQEHTCTFSVFQFFMAHKEEVARCTTADRYQLVYTLILSLTLTLTLTLSLTLSLTPTQPYSCHNHWVGLE